MFSQLIVFLSALVLLNGAMAQSDSASRVSTTTLLNHVQSTSVAYVTMTGTPPVPVSTSESSTSESSAAVTSATGSTSSSLPTASNTTLASTTAALPTSGGNGTNSTTSAHGSPTLAPHGGAGNTIGVSSGLMAALIGFVVMLN